MPLILNIETTTKNCSVSLSENEEILALKELNNGGYTHGENLHIFIDKLFKETNNNLQKVDAIAVSEGPGSYTGLRIGVATAKGLCYSLEKPLISVATLASLAHEVDESGNYLIVPMLDARRMEVYAAVFDSNYTLQRETRAEIIDESSYREFLNTNKVYFLGDGVEKSKTIIQHDNALFLSSYLPSARTMAKLAYTKYKAKDFEDIAYFEPFYLKDFLITPKKKLTLFYNFNSMWIWYFNTSFV